MIYRISEGVLLRKESEYDVPEALIKGVWRQYNGIHKDWDTNSSPATEKEVKEQLKVVKK